MVVVAEECIQSCYLKLGYGFQFFIIKHFLKLSKRHRIVFCIRKDFEVLQAEPGDEKQPPDTAISGLQEHRRGAAFWGDGPLCFNNPETSLCHF